MMNSIAMRYCPVGHSLRNLLTALLLVCAADAGAREAVVLPPLPEPRANTPLAMLDGAAGRTWFAGPGIGAGKSWRDLRADGWILRPDAAQWQRLPPIPAYRGLAGRLGSHAIVLDSAIHLVGGYTVAEDGSERSTPGIWRLALDPAPAWVRAGTMPVPVDDAVAVVWRERTLVLVSGWSDTGNVNLVQLWTPSESAWSQAEPWPGAPVFGHAGGLIGDVLVVCGGARVHYPATGPRQFLASDECWQGRLRGDDSGRLDWRPLPPMPGGPRYRAAALGLHIHDADRVIFAGGADRPYNYDGEGYDGMPATPIDTVVGFNIDTGRWECHGRMPEARMDHRGLLFDGHRLVLPGGMDGHRRVRAEVLAWPLADPATCEADDGDGDGDGDGDSDASGNERGL
jgi:hypothetical protein